MFDITMSELLLHPYVRKFLLIVAALLILNLLLGLLRRSLLARVDSNDTRYRLRKVFSFTSFFVSLAIITWAFSDHLGGLSVSIGVAGAGVAFALQEVIASFAGWIAVSIGGFYSVGDRVQLGGIVGDVIDVGVIRTTLMETGQWVKGDQYSGRIVRISNSFVFKEPVFNYSADFPFVWDEITVPVKYGSDHRLAKALLQQTADEILGEYVPRARATWELMLQKYRIEEASVSPTVTLVANDNWLEYTIRYVVDYKRRRSTKDQLFTRILDAFETSAGRVAMASATFHLVEAPVFDVRLVGAGGKAATAGEPPGG